MNLSKLVLLAIFTATPALPVISIGNANHSVTISDTWGLLRLTINGSNFSVRDSKIVCNNKSHGIATTIDRSYIKTVIECIHGNCTETKFNASGVQIYPELPTNSPEIAPKTGDFGFFAKYPLLTPVLIGCGALAAGYGLYKLSKWVQKPKKQ